MVNFFHVQPLDSDHLAPSVNQSFLLATIFRKKMQLAISILLYFYLLSNLTHQVLVSIGPTTITIYV